jgi:hypothetical protein
MRELAPPSTRFPVREPAGSLRVENPTTEHEWRAYIGARVLVQPAARGGGKDRIRPVPARLVNVFGLRGEVSLPHHKGTELVPLVSLKRWVKGEHEDAARMDAHARSHGNTITAPIHFYSTPEPAPKPEVPMIAHAEQPILHGTCNASLAYREAQRSMAKGKILARDANTGKYWVGGRPGIPFDLKLHGFVGDIERARLTSPGAAEVALNRFGARAGSYNLEYLTVEQASIHYGDRHAALDAPPAPKEHTPELMPREEAKPEPKAAAPAPVQSVMVIDEGKSSAVALPAPGQVAVSPTSTNLDRMRAAMDGLETAIRNKATADAMAASEGIEVRKCEELLRAAKMRIELGL